MKKYILFLVAFLPVLAFAAWSQPTATPPGGNCEPPINVGNISQVKGSMIGATEFCIYKPDRTTKVACLGGNSTNNSLNTTKFCLNNSCISNWTELLSTAYTPITQNFWQKIINANGVSKIIAGNGIKISSVPATNVGQGDVTVSLSNQPDPASPVVCQDGQVLRWSTATSKWACSFSVDTEKDTLQTVTGRGFNTNSKIGVAGLVVSPNEAWFSNKIRITGGNPGPNKILVSTDSLGNAEWKTINEVMNCVPNCNCAASTNIGSTCTNSCGTGSCAGIKSGGGGCVPNCDCAANINIGSICANSCGTGMCAGIKPVTPACVPNCNCAANTNIGSQCTNSCGTGSCAGTKSVTPACVPNCSCAANTNIGSTCTNSCGTGSCAGTKCVPNCNCASSTYVRSTCTNSCGTGTCAGTKPYPCEPKCDCASVTNIGSTCTNSCGTGQCQGTKVAVGANYGGGIVGYIFQPGDTGYKSGETHGLVVSNDQSTKEYWTWDVGRTYAVGWSIGTGILNTSTIMIKSAARPIAASRAYNYSGGGFTDWFLPSRAELEKLCANKTLIGGFSYAGQYWSSTEIDETRAWGQSFDSGCVPTMFDKQQQLSVRYVRAF